MKSPAYRAGQHNLRGKKRVTLSCRCCDMLNMKDEVRWKEADKEIKEQLRDSSVR